MVRGMLILIDGEGHDCHSFCTGAESSELVNSWENAYSDLCLGAKRSWCLYRGVIVV